MDGREAQGRSSDLGSEQPEQSLVKKEGLCPCLPGTYLAPLHAAATASASAQSDRGGSAGQREDVRGVIGLVRSGGERPASPGWGQLVITAHMEERPLCAWPVLYLWTDCQPWESPREEGVIMVLLLQLGKRGTVKQKSSARGGLLFTGEAPAHALNPDTLPP